MNTPKKILSDLLEKEKVYRENEGEGDDDSDRSDISDSSDGEESQSESNDVESDNESDQEKIIQQESSKPCHHCENWNLSVTAVVKCLRCFWYENNSICPICGYDNEHIKEALVQDGKALKAAYRQNAKKRKRLHCAGLGVAARKIVVAVYMLSNFNMDLTLRMACALTTISYGSNGYPRQL